MISVCIATFNGSSYIERQLASILDQIGPMDEIIICDDASEDETISLIESYKDNRISIHINKVRLGHVNNFAKALSYATGDYIFLSDQDDIWLPGRVDKMLLSLTSDVSVLLVASNFDLIDEFDKHIGEFRKLKPENKSKLSRVLKIFLGKMPYYGCTFVFKKELLELCLPIPAKTESHDIWMALIANTFGVVNNLNIATLQHRIHQLNVTPRKRRSALVIVKSRIVLIKAYVARVFKLKFKKPL
ncbi:glycosyltransferase family 2 protein [Glaciimonas soli]|uniref:Glycosyltransferase n=1 Tax=Glaciimonas soli TaxID=2590999 RepID=A0A843YUK9_9BURK|nr:glycosyltransferase family 2 protein [Glaciimonas soli]MQR01323.1 glycosyltransferase [Glaciimonas soli]